MKLASASKRRRGLRKAVPVLLTLITFYMFCSTAMSALNHGSVPDEVHTTKYIVQPGDTVWSIGSMFDKTDDPRSVSDWIYSANRLLSGQPLMPGQVLIVPTTGNR